MGLLRVLRVVSGLRPHDGGGIRGERWALRPDPRSLTRGHGSARPPVGRQPRGDACRGAFLRASVWEDAEPRRPRARDPHGRITICVHLVLLIVGREANATTLPGYDLLLSWTWPSVIYALDIAAWDLCLGSALVLAAAAFPGPRLSTSIRRGLLLRGGLCLAGLLGAALGTSTCGTSVSSATRWCCQSCPGHGATVLRHPADPDRPMSTPTPLGTRWLGLSARLRSSSPSQHTTSVGGHAGDRGAGAGSGGRGARGRPAPRRHVAGGSKSWTGRALSCELPALGVRRSRSGRHRLPSWSRWLTRACGCRSRAA
jgi:hypothetical protein